MRYVLMCNGRREVQGGGFMPPRLPKRQRAKGQTGGGIGHCQPPTLPGHRGAAWQAGGEVVPAARWPSMSSCVVQPSCSMTGGLVAER